MWLTAAGSFAAFAGAISIPGVSQLLGCAPVGPLGWAQALGSTGAAVLAIAAAPHLLPAGKPRPEASAGDTEPPTAIVETLRPAREAVAPDVDAARVFATV